MRVLFLSDVQTVLLIFILWPVIQVGTALFCLRLPNKFFLFTKGLYKTKAFEKQGKLYETLFQVKKWKHLLPDGGALYKKRGYAKKTLTDYSTENLNRFLTESCRAELTHWLPIAFFWLFFFFTTPFTTFLMFVYSVLVNLPCILVQRYNRPRIEKLLASKHPN